MKILSVNKLIINRIYGTFLALIHRKTIKKSRVFSFSNYIFAGKLCCN